MLDDGLFWLPKLVLNGSDWMHHMQFGIQRNHQRSIIISLYKFHLTAHLNELRTQAGVWLTINTTNNCDQYLPDKLYGTYKALCMLWSCMNQALMDRSVQNLNVIWNGGEKWYEKSMHHRCLFNSPLLMAKRVWPSPMKRVGPRKKTKTKTQIHTRQRLLSNLFSAQLVLNEVIMTH